MTDTLVNASKLKPEIRLARAVSAFKAVLTAEHKATFDRSISTIQDHPPNATEVARLTAEIDRNVTRKTRRCFGPRFMNVLQAVQRYASMGDIVIGGSQNLVACGVWAAVRLTLTMLSQGASYLEKMSLLFMQAGRNAPRYEDMALLYPRSKRLQDGFCEYFIVVVNLCQHAVQFIQKSTISRMTLAMTDSSLSSFEKDLQQWSVFIMEEVVLLSGQNAEEEAKENSRFRKVMAKFSTFSEHQQKLARKIRLLDACSTHDYQTPWKQARKQGTTTWFASNAEYQTWREQTSSCSMLCIGKLGSGKTTLIANMVDDLIHLAPSGSVAYFFCRYDVCESLTARTILGCLARQLLGQQPVDLTNVDRFFDDPLAHRDEHFIIDILRELLPTGPVYILVLDGLYECPESEQQTTIELLHQLQQHFKILICLSFRKDTENHVKVTADDLNGKWTLTIPENNPDIEAYIDAELHERLESDRLSVGDPAIILSIQHALVTGAQGMFLWATLLLDCICAEQTDEAILQALESLPQSLSETFIRVLQQASASNMQHRHKIVQLVMAARRPLSVEELREAISVIPGDTTWQPGRQINNIYSALASCKCLIIIDEEEQTVRFAHHSVKQFFIAQGDQPGNTTPINPDEANKEMGRIILTYLNYGIFDRQVSRRVYPSIPAEDAPARIVSSILGGSANTKRIALELLKTRKNHKRDVGQILAETAIARRKAPVQSHPFVTYAKTYYMHHIRRVWYCEERMEQLWLRLLRNESLDLRIVGWLQYELQQRRVTGLDGDFVPCGVLSQLLRYDVVSKALEETGYVGHEASVLAYSIVEVRQRCFAIFVDMGIIDHTRVLWMKDRDLPISRVQFLEKFKPKISQITVSPTVGSMETDRWEKLAELFCLRQREYLAPILHQGGHYNSEEGVMPFLPIENATDSDDESILALVHPAHHDFPYRGTKNVVDAGYQVALKSLYRRGIAPENQLLMTIGPDNKFLMSHGGSSIENFHLLQAIASYRPREQGGTPQPIRLIFPLSGANLHDVWRQNLITDQVQPLLRWSLAQMAGLAEALAFVIRNDPEERYLSLDQITPYNVQWFKHPALRSHALGGLHLDLRTLMVGQRRAPVRHFEEGAYRAPYDAGWGTWPDDAEGRCVWSLGCIYFEFLIWAVKGSTNLQKFREARGGANTPFHSKISSDAYEPVDPSTRDHYRCELSSEVCRWAEILQRGSDLPLTVRHLIEYLLANVLAVHPKARVSASKLASDLEELRAKSEALEPAYHIQKDHLEPFEE